MNENQLLCVIPAYNEEGRIGKLVRKVIPLTEKVIVVNDGSTDNTYEELKSAGVEIISHSRNLGKGQAIRTGMDYFLKKSNYEFLVFLDGDGQHDPEDIPKFLKKMMDDPECDIVIASRFKTREWQENMPFSRKLSNLMSRFGLWLLYNGLVIEDPQNGFRAYRRRTINHMQFYTHRFEAETEILIESYLMGFKFDVVNIQSIYDKQHSDSNFSLFYDTWKIPGIMIKLFLKRKPWLYREYQRKLYYRIHNSK